ncbi:hypothetical protein ACROYT_G014982 [Oculina patagonica]
MTPYPSPSTATQEQYNTSHTKTRVVVEQTLRRWKRRFHVLHSEIRMSPMRACNVIGGCAVLHTLAVLLNEPINDDSLDIEPKEVDPYHGPQRGFAMRDHIFNTYFAQYVGDSILRSSSIDDGTVVQNHALYSTDPQSLKIILYYDDVEVTNEQTRRKHKLVMFYFKLANLYPDLKSINLLAIVEYQLLTTHGMDNILAPFIEELKTLGRDTGVDLRIQSGVVRLRGAQLAVIEDTPASQLLGVCWRGEKEMLPFA